MIAGLGQAGDVTAYAGEMQLQSGIAFGVGGRVHVIGVGSERNFGVDNQVAAAGQENNDVGARGFGLCCRLRLRAGEVLLEAVLLAFAKAGLFQQIAKDELAPVALGLWRAAQGGGQILRFFGKLLVQAPQASPIRPRASATPVLESLCACSTFSRNSLICVLSGSSSVPSSFWLPSEKVFDFCFRMSAARA